jgi:hypothetical protein
MKPEKLLNTVFNVALVIILLCVLATLLLIVLSV